MASGRTSAKVIDELLRAMRETVTSYHPKVERTSENIEGLIQGTACFPGGAGLWRGNANGGPLPEFFPDRPVMLVGHNFDSQRGYALSFARRGEVEGDFWTRLLRILEAAGLKPESCFFTNVLMGLKPGGAEGPMPSVPGYREQCRRFLERQVDIVKPRAVIALGKRSIEYVSGLSCSFLELRHPGDWCFRPLADRDSLLGDEGHKLREFLCLPRTEIPSKQPGGPGMTKSRVPMRSLDFNGRVAKSVFRSSAAVDHWGFRADSRNAFLMRALERGGRTKEEIRLEFLEAFPLSAGKSTFNVFFTDVIRPFGSASVSRYVRIERSADGRLRLDPERAGIVKAAISSGILAEINALEGAFPKKNLRAIDEIVERHRGAA